MIPCNLETLDIVRLICAKAASASPERRDSKERGNALHKKREGANGGPFKKCDKTM